MTTLGSNSQSPSYPNAMFRGLYLKTACSNESSSSSSSAVFTWANLPLPTPVEDCPAYEEPCQYWPCISDQSQLKPPSSHNMASPEVITQQHKGIGNLFGTCLLLGQAMSYIGSPASRKAKRYDHVAGGLVQSASLDKQSDQPVVCN